MATTVEVPKLNKTQRGIVQRIRDKVEATHWTKHSYETKTDEGKPQYCMVGFVNKELRVPDVTAASGDIEVWSPSKRAYVPLSKNRQAILDAMFAAIKKVKPRTKATSIESFNDARTTKREDVLAVLDLILEEGAS